MWLLVLRWDHVITYGLVGNAVRILEIIFCKAESMISVKYPCLPIHLALAHLIFLVMHSSLIANGFLVALLVFCCDLSTSFLWIFRYRRYWSSFFGGNCWCFPLRFGHSDATAHQEVVRLLVSYDWNHRFVDMLHNRIFPVLLRFWCISLFICVCSSLCFLRLSNAISTTTGRLHESFSPKRSTARTPPEPIRSEYSQDITVLSSIVKCNINEQTVCIIVGETEHCTHPTRTHQVKILLTHHIQFMKANPSDNVLNLRTDHMHHCKRNETTRNTPIFHYNLSDQNTKQNGTLHTFQYNPSDQTTLDTSTTSNFCKTTRLVMLMFRFQEWDVAFTSHLHGLIEDNSPLGL